MNLMVGALPNGRVDNDVLGDQTSKLHDCWPAETTWIPAVSLDTGELTVFGRDEGHDVDVADAVAASCAIPAFFRPVKINGQRYVDGGTRSMVNVDLLADLDLDLVVVLSPMSLSAMSPRSPFASVLRGFPTFQLAKELAVLDEAGIPHLTLEPDRGTARAMGANPMDPTCVVPSLTAATASATASLAEERHSDALGMLTAAGLQLTSPADVAYPD